LSILGIKNTIKDLGLRYDVNHDIAKQTLASAAFTESAIRDWEHKYPHDREVPRAMYFLQRLYAHIVYDQSQLKARATAAWLFADYPRSPQAKVLKKAIAEATPLPSASAAPSEAQQAAPAASSSSAPSSVAAPASPDASAAPASSGSSGSSVGGPSARSSSAPTSVSSPAPKSP
jgi:hypothetical protein